MRLSAWLFVCLIGFGLTACYDGEDGNNKSSAAATATETTSTVTNVVVVGDNEILLTGTVATGKAFQGWIAGTNAKGEVKETSINGDGSYTLVMPEGAPYLLMAVGTNNNAGETLYSYTNAIAKSATVNITDLTTAVLQLAAGRTLTDMQNLFSNWASHRTAQVSIDTAQQVVQNQLSSLFAQASLDPANIDVFTTPFQPNGYGLDGVMDLITEVRYNGGMLTLIGQNGQALFNSFDLASNTSTASSNATATDMAGDWTLVVSGTISSSLIGGSQNIPNFLFQNTQAPTTNDFSAINGTLNQVQGDVTGTISNLNITTVTDTANQKIYNVTFIMNTTQLHVDVALDYNLTYDYTR